MPELPEVETIVRALRPRLSGRRIVSAEFSSKFVTPGDRSKLARSLAGRKIQSIERRGKHILVQLDRGVLAIHLGMTGKLLVGAEQGPYTRGRFELDRGTLIYDDIRQFGRIGWSEAVPERIARLGPEPLEVAFEEFQQRLAKHRSAIKPLLLNQIFLRGVGNIYADEALFQAKIHPRTIASRLRRERAERLHRSIVEVLTAAIAAGGSSISDYVDSDGNPGSFQFDHCVYGREGEPCLACGASIKRIVLAQRGTHYCPRCQRA